MPLNKGTVLSPHPCPSPNGRGVRGEGYKNILNVTS